MQVTDATAKQMQYILMTFIIRRDGTDLKSWTFLINPDTYIQTEPIRANVIQTLGGGYIDAFGRGLTTIRISGTSGWRLRFVTGSSYGVTDGWQYWQDFLENVYRYFIDKTNEDDKHTYELRFYNWMDKEYWAVYFADNLQWRRQAPQDSLWRRFDFTLTCLYPLSQPSDPSKIQIVGQTVINKDDKTMSAVVDIQSQLLNIGNQLYIKESIIKQLIALNKISVLNIYEQQHVKTYGYYDIIEPNEELTNYNFPGIQKYTGKLGESKHPAGTVLDLIDNGVVPLAWSITLYLENKTELINMPYSSVISLSKNLYNLAQTLSEKYSPPPKYLIKELMNIYKQVSLLIGHPEIFSIAGVGLI